MRGDVLFEGQPQRLGFAVLNEIFRRRTVGALVGESGTGKTELLRAYIKHCLTRQAWEDRRRRVVTFDRALDEFERRGVFSDSATSRQRGWLGERFGGALDSEADGNVSYSRRASSMEIEHWMAAYRKHANRPPPDLEEPQLEEDEPPTVPRPILIVPSATTTPSALVRLVHRRIGQPRQPAFHLTDEVLEAALGEFRQKRALFLIIDEAQRMRPETAAMVREFWDDGSCPLLLCGTPDLDVLLARPALASLRRRIAIREVIRPLSQEDLREFLPHLEARFVAALHGCSGGRFGVILNLLDAAAMVRDADGRGSLTLEDLEEATKIVPEAGPYTSTGRIRQTEERGGSEPRSDRKTGATAAAAGAEALRHKAARSAG